MKKLLSFIFIIFLISTISCDEIQSDGLCVILEAGFAETSDSFLYIAENFHVDDRAEAEAYTSEFSINPGFVLHKRTILTCYCSETVFEECDESDPIVVGTDLQCNEFENICEMKNYVHQWAGTEIGGNSSFQVYRFNDTCRNN